MTTEVFYVTGVHSRQTRVGGVTRFDVLVRRPEEPLARLVLGTVNDYCGQLCHVAEETKQPLTITWKDGPFGYDLVDCAVRQ